MKTWIRALGRACGVGLSVAAFGVAGCGETSQGGNGGGGGDRWSTGGTEVGGGSGDPGGDPGGDPPPPDVLSEVPCEPYRPSEAAWSSLHTARPAIIGMVSASPSGHYLYTAGTWLDAGRLQHRALRSRDFGETWCVLSTPEPVVTIAASRADERVLYALTPSEAGAASVLLRSGDGGVTWTAGDAPLPEGFFDVERHTSDLRTSLTDPNLVWVQRYVTRPEFGSEFYVSRDAGATWSAPRPPALLPRLDPPPERILREVLGVAVDPHTGDRLVVWGEVGPIGSLTPLVWFSSIDGGATWSQLHLPDTATAATVDAASVIYVSTDSKLLISEDWGTTWEERGSMPESASLISMTPPSAGHLFAKSYSNALWRTIDGGTTWTTLSDGDDESVTPILSGRDGSLLVSVGDRWLAAAPDGSKPLKRSSIVPTPSQVVVSPVDPQRLWAQEDGDVLVSRNGGSTWTFQAREAWLGPNGLLPDAIDPDAALLFNTQAGGLLLSASSSEDGGRSWTSLSSVLDTDRSVTLMSGVATCPGPTSCALLLSQSGDSWQCELKKTTDRGRTWLARAMPNALCGGGGGSPPENLLVVSPGDPEHLLAACDIGDVCETRDGGMTWTPHPLHGNTGPVTSIAFLDDRTVVLIKHTFNGTTFVLRSTDGGATWATVHDTRDALRVIASKARPATAFLTHGVDAYAPELNSALSRSDDGGATWNAVAQATTPVDLNVTSVVDAVGGGFLATTRYGLVHFE